MAHSHGHHHHDAGGHDHHAGHGAGHATVEPEYGRCADNAHRQHMH